MVPGSCEYETWNAATVIPVTGTEYCGLPRDGVSESFTGSHVQRDGCLLKSVNHSQPLIPIRAGASRMRPRNLAFIAHLHRSMFPKQRLRVGRSLGRTFHPHSVIPAAETR